ncbi:ShlB/FhaC/HecB family hemolysin secretion/activation protein [Qipengyuania sp. MTN3-11]|uniref:ShlB/FhaC/HecB family hemolysin secretion/activation protein n=1 Tax=Qipengyuania sp. MTN3-11 TaxID=3056557 RepID=UPI0036F35873
MIGFRHLFAGAVSLAALVAPLALSAQTTTPGVPTREEVLREELNRQLRESQSPLDLDGAFQRAPCPLAGDQFADIALTLAESRFAGAENIEPGLLDPAWRPYVGREIPIATVCDIRDRAAALLREAGYVASVQVPVQTIEGGVVRFDVVVARLTGLVVRGETGPSGQLIERYFGNLRGREVFVTGEAERYLLLARDIPGLDVRLSLTRDLSAGAGPGDLVGVVDVIHTPFEADLAVQNLGTRTVGRIGGQLRAQFNGLTGLGDLTEISAFATADLSEQYVLSGRHEFAIGSDGLRAGISATHAWTQPDVPGPDVFEARTLIATAQASYPLVRKQAQTIRVRAGLDYINQDVDFSGLALAEDDLRVGFVALEFEETDLASIQGRGGYNIAKPRWYSRGRIELRQGLDIFGASDDCGPAFAACLVPGAVPISRFVADPTAFVLRGEGAVDFRPMQDWKFSLRPRFQYSPDAVLPYEQFSGGNYTVGRGYDPGSVIGDSGFGGQAEIANGSLLPPQRDGFAFQPFAFFDTIATWIKGDPTDPFTLNSAGGGVRVNYANRVFVEILGAVPLERAPLQTRRGDARLLVNLAVRLGS